VRPVPFAFGTCFRGVLFRAFTHPGRHAPFSNRVNSARNASALTAGRTAAAMSTGVVNSFSATN